METQAIPQVAELAERETNELVTRFNYPIEDVTAYSQATADLKILRDKEKQLDELRKNLTKPLDESKSRIMDFFRGPTDKIKSAMGAIKSRMIAFDDKVRAIEAENLRKAEEALRKEREEKAKELEARVVEAMEDDQPEQASKIANQLGELQLTPIPQIVLRPAKLPTARGAAVRAHYKALVTDMKLLPEEYKLPDLTALNKLGNASGGTLKIAGVIWEEVKFIG